MGYSKKNIEFAHTPIGVCSLALWVEAIAAAASIGVFAYVYLSSGLPGKDIVKGSLILLSLLVAGCCGMFMCSRRRQNSITMGDSLISLKTHSGVREILFYDDIASVKSNRENVFILMKNGRVIGLLADDFVDERMRGLFVDELKKRITELSAESEKALSDGKPRSVWVRWDGSDEKDAA